MFSLFKKKDVDAKKIIDEIENAVYAEIKQFGFKKYGRTLHRVVSGDISQVIHFQAGRNYYAGKMWVNLGIRVPECVDRKFKDINNDKKYYQELECNMRSRLGEIRNKKENLYDLSKNTNTIILKIVKEIVSDVLPVFDKLSTRQAILEYRRAYPTFDTMGSHLILLEEAMIYARLNDMSKANERFNEYYRLQVAEKNGYVTIYGASHSHIDYLEALAEELGFQLQFK